VDRPFLAVGGRQQQIICGDAGGDARNLRQAGER
jgi:hypothetical protein